MSSLPKRKGAKIKEPRKGKALHRYLKRFPDRDPCKLCTEFQIWPAFQRDHPGVCMLEEKPLTTFMPAPVYFQRIPGYDMTADVKTDPKIAQENFNQHVAVHLLNPVVQRIDRFGGGRWKPHVLFVVFLYYGFDWGADVIVRELCGKDIWKFGDMPTDPTPEIAQNWQMHAERRIQQDILDVFGVAEKWLVRGPAIYEVGLELGLIVCSQNIEHGTDGSEFAKRLPVLFDRFCQSCLMTRWKDKRCYHPTNLFINRPLNHHSHPGGTIQYKDLDFKTWLEITTKDQGAVRYIIEECGVEAEKKELLEVLAARTSHHTHQS